MQKFTNDDAKGNRNIRQLTTKEFEVEKNKEMARQPSFMLLTFPDFDAAKPDEEGSGVIEDDQEIQVGTPVGQSYVFRAPV